MSRPAAPCGRSPSATSARRRSAPATEPRAERRECVSSSPRPRSSPRSRARRRLTSFDYYVLTLSWSPGFCDTGGAAKQPSQCARGAGAGFVVHGLWPNNAAGPNPEDCGGGAYVPAAALRLTDGVYPDEGLARYEYRKHGTCSGLDPQAYFAAVKTLRDGDRRPRNAEGAARDADDFARRADAGLHRRQRQSHGRQHGDHLPRRRTHRRAHLRRQEPDRLRAMPEGGGPHLPCRVDLRRAAALSGRRARACDELPPRLPRRQFRRRLQARDPRPHPRLSDAEGRAAALHRHPRRRRPLRSRQPRRRGARRNGATASRGSSRRARRPRSRRCFAPISTRSAPSTTTGGRPPIPARRRWRRRCCRPQDRIALCEAHPEERERLDRGARARPAAVDRRHRRLCRAQRLCAAEGAARARADRSAVRGAARRARGSRRRSPTR